MRLSDIIRQRRSALGLTQDEVAGRVGISKPYLSTIETGKVRNPPSDKVLKAIEDVLDFSEGELVRLAHLQRTPSDVRREHSLLSEKVNRFQSLLESFVHDAPRTAGGELDLESLADVLGMSGFDARVDSGASIPVINSVGAGYPQEFGDLDYPVGIAEEYIRCPDVNDPQAFAAHVVGDSMQPNYQPGDLVVFSPNAPARNGDDCFVRFLPGEGTTFKRFYQDSPTSVRLQPLNNAYPARTYRPEEFSGLWPAVLRIEKLR